MPNHKKFIFVTGVSTGIGSAIVEKLLIEGYEVIGSVRSQNDADRLAVKFQNRLHVVFMDITMDNEIINAVKKTEHITKNNGLYALINNAGIALGGPMKYINLKDLKNQFDINVFGIVSLSQKLLPLLEINKGDSRIINMSSVSGLITTAFLGPYCGSKYALEALSDAMRIEFKLLGVKVIIIEPGPIDTPIWGKSKQAASKYLDTEYGPYINQLETQLDKIKKNALPMARMNLLLMKILKLQNPKLRYLLVRKPIIFKFMLKFLPVKWMDNFQSRLIKLKNQNENN